MTLKIVTAPAVEVLTAAETKARLGIDDTVSDAVMEVFVKAARQMHDGAQWLGRAFITQTWDLIVDRFDSYNYLSRETGFYPGIGYQENSRYLGNQDRLLILGGIPIPMSPLQGVTSVKYLDSDGVQQTLDPVNYVVVPGEPSRIVLSTTGAWPSTAYMAGAVTIRFVAGYGNASEDVPEPIRMAIALQASHLQQMSAPSFWLNSERVEGIDSVTYAPPSGFAALSDAVKTMLMPYRVWVP